MTKTIAISGDCGIDEFLTYGKDMPGGCSLNLAVHLNRHIPAGWNIHILSYLGDDPNALRIREVMSKNGFGNTVPSLKGDTPRCLIRNLDHGERVFEDYFEGVLENRRLNEEQSEVMRSADWGATVLSKQYKDLFESVLEARPREFLSADFMNMNDFGKDPNFLVQYLPKIDLAFFGLELDEPFYKEVRKLAKEFPQVTFACTLGPDGVHAFRKDQKFEAKAPKVEKVIDTTGAGDSFAGFLLSELMKKRDLQPALEKAATYASQTVQRLGAF